MTADPHPSPRRGQGQPCAIPAAGAWVRRFAPLVAAGGAVLDIAAGGGRNGRAFAARGHPVTLVDRDVSGLSDLATDQEVIAADLEDGSPWPLAGRRFAGVVCTNYLFRPLFPLLAAALEPGGVLIYETFQKGNEAYGRPRNPDHLLDPGELLNAFPGLQVVAYETGRDENTCGPKVVQRLCAVNATAPVDLTRLG